MKKSLVASGFMGIVASLLGVAAVGCSAETGSPEAEVGSTDQALAINISEVNGYGVKFPAYIKVAANQALVVAGYDPSNGGVGTKTIKLATYDSTPNPDTVTWSDILDSNGAAIALPDNLGEAEIIQLSGSQYLVTGGRDSDGGTVSNKGYVLDITANAASVVSHTMVSARVNHKMVPCTNSKVLVIGGNSGSAALSSLEVYDPSGGTFASFKNEAGTPATVSLNVARLHHQAVALNSDATKVFVFGGENTGGTPLADTELIQLDASNCRLDSSTDTTATAKAAGANEMATRTQFAAFPLTSTITVSSVVYDVIAAGGFTSGGTVYTDSILYSSASDKWINTANGAPALAGTTKKHIRPMFHPDGSGGFIIAGGKEASSGNTSVTTAETEIFSASAFSNTNMTDTRFAGWVIPAGTNYVAGQGVKRALVMGSIVESALTAAE